MFLFNYLLSSKPNVVIILQNPVDVSAVIFANIRSKISASRVEMDKIQQFTVCTTNFLLDSRAVKYA